MKNKWLYMGVILLVVISSGLFYMGQIKDKEGIRIETENSKKSVEYEEDIDEVMNKSYIHICGAVKNPDVYEVNENARLFEVIAMAGGLEEDAVKGSVNLARKVMDGEQIYVPFEGEEQISYITQENQSKVSLNQGTKEQLMTLTGIGEVRANAIIKHRTQKGPFVRIEDIMLVEGIKEAMFEKIKDDIGL
ncbi:ComEA family DNA-binding protein [Petrocella sp. FN5]|uniref:ComEA family DNA-binding protein n=1 Tax=Petrocella sp. FN5 TaxID=3032002 RepID=UPI0023DBD736|nr:ComEA family DNA-binding protein [Petrocella sp. FN5]MDF1616568.1 ComEA family DNA-binding protein [Petrocella sp. FN5]